MDKDKEFNDNEAQKLMDEEEKYIEDIINTREEPLEEELKELHMNQARLNFIANLFKEREEWKNNLMELKDFKVLKMPRVLQSVFYFLQYKREDICEKDTNKFFWKKAKHLLDDDFITRLVDYNALGPKEDNFQRY